MCCFLSPLRLRQSPTESPTLSPTESPTSKSGKDSGESRDGPIRRRKLRKDKELKAAIIDPEQIKLRRQINRKRES